MTEDPDRLLTGAHNPKRTRPCSHVTAFSRTSLFLERFKGNRKKLEFSEVSSYRELEENSRE